MDIGVKQQTKPARKMSLFSRFCFTWTLPLFWTGARRDLLLSDLEGPSEADQSERVADDLEREWKLELKKAKADLSLLETGSGKESLSKAKPSLLRAIIRVCWFPFLFTGLIRFIDEVILRVMQPWFLSAVIVYFMENDPVNRTSKKTTAYWNALGIAGVTVVMILAWHHTLLQESRFGMRIRVACSSLVYRKILRLDQRSINNIAVGKVVNLLSNDVSRFDRLLVSLHSIWITLIQSVVYGYVMWQYVGISAVIGIAVATTQAIPVQSYFSICCSRLRAQISVRTDSRVQFMSELFASIQVIKMYAWENPFELMVTGLRAAEMKVIERASYLRAIYYGNTNTSDKLNLYFTLGSFVLMGNSLSAESLFVLTSLFNSLKISSYFAYSIVLNAVAEAKVSIERLQEFLMLDEMKLVDDLGVEKIDEVMIKIANLPEEKRKEVRIEMDRISACWSRDQTPSTLHDVAIIFESQSLCGMVGPVGSGKSSLLHVILGELTISSGTLSFYTEAGGNVPSDRRNLRVSYCSQNPWLFSSTIRSNILFGESYNEKRYVEVTSVCALQDDFKELLHGDLSFVGERGSALSGGQRARVNLARAIYKVADVYLFDDIFSAVDAHVGQHLFDKCIKEYLRGTTRIIVTHELQFLKEMDKIIVLDQGSVRDHGAFDELTESYLLMTIAEEKHESAKAGIESKDKDVGETVNCSMMKLSTKEAFVQREGKMNDTVKDTSKNNVEEVEAGKMFREVLGTYFRAGGNIVSITRLVICYLAGQVSLIGVDYWLSHWTDVEIFKSRFSYNAPNATRNDTLIASSWYDEHGLLTAEGGFIIYTLAIILCIALIILRTFWFINSCMNSSRNIHNSTFSNLLWTSMRFFNVTPSGRILNRFSKDVGTMDELLPEAMVLGLDGFLFMVGIMILIVISTYWMIIPIIVVGIPSYLIAMRYLKTAQNLKHLEGIAKSPVFSLADSTISGLTIIRSRGSYATNLLREGFDRHQDTHTAAWNALLDTMVTFGFLLDALSCILTSSICVVLIYIDDGSISGGIAGLAISQSLMLTGTLQYGIRRCAEAATQMTVVERILQYSRLPPEGRFVTSNLRAPNWPTKGDLHFKGVNMKYVEQDLPALKNINVDIQPGWKVGIVGRTGAGKSSLISALFRLVDDGLTGEIIVDSVNIKTIGLHELRARISIIPQQPVLFSASLRFNLDPFGQYSDSQLWDCLREVELGDAIPSLDYQVSAGGANFSTGQRQLICLARAILRHDRILVLDEVTANIDPRTDVFIQNTIRRKFANCTVLTIAHRLSTIMDSDRVLVMERGAITEFDHPLVLLQNPDGCFSNLVREAGQSLAKSLASAAMQD